MTIAPELLEYIVLVQNNAFVFAANLTNILVVAEVNTEK